MDARVRRVGGSVSTWSSAVLEVAQALARDEQVEVVVAGELARSARPHDLLVAADRDDDRRARQLRVAHERAGRGCRGPRRVARRARSAASRASPLSISASRGTGCALDEVELARGPAHRQPLRGDREHDDEEDGVEDAQRARARRRRSGKVASTIGTPPRRPAQARKPCSRSDEPERRRAQRAPRAGARRARARRRRGSARGPRRACARASRAARAARTGRAARATPSPAGSRARRPRAGCARRR